jgi:hypothetical protein
MKCRACNEMILGHMIRTGEYGAYYCAICVPQADEDSIRLECELRAANKKERAVDDAWELNR